MLTDFLTHVDEYWKFPHSCRCGWYFCPSHDVCSKARADLGWCLFNSFLQLHHPNHWVCVLNPNLKTQFSHPGYKISKPSYTNWVTYIKTWLSEYQLPPGSAKNPTIAKGWMCGTGDTSQPLPPMMLEHKCQVWMGVNLHLRLMQ